ncbi:MAG: alpha-glucan family phosphorylase [Candidatus Binatia bacterium]
MATQTLERNDGQRDIERAIAELAARLPEPLAPLARVVYNYRWLWFAGARSAFSSISPSNWRQTDCKHYLIQSFPQGRMRALAEQPHFVARLRAAAEAIEADLERPWAQTAIPPEHPIVYLCAEFGIHCSLPIYAGGLGVLAGDMLKAASDMAIPMVGVGLLYREGYVHQRIDETGWQQEYWTAVDFDRLPVVLVSGADQRPLTVEVVVRHRTVHIQIWRLDIGRVPLYLLDTDRADNHPVDRWITSRLYIGDRHTRLAQYLVLGLGGMRALAAMGIQPSLVHLNEGHGALSTLERVREQVAAGVSVEEAEAAVWRDTVFTTHTPVPAGNEGYTQEEMEPVLGDFAERMGIPRTTFYGIGRVNPMDEREPILPTVAALRTSRAINGVSRRHGAAAREMWHVLWPGRRIEDVPIEHVTNGVHTTSWMAGPMQALLDRALAPDWRRRLCEPELWTRIADIPDADLWAVRNRLREQLVEFARERSMYDRLGSRGDRPDYVESAAAALDPAVLTIGFARRVANYKRLYLLGRLPDNGLMRLLADGPRPVQFILAGKAHPQDKEAKETIRRRFELRRDPRVARRMVYLEDYDLHMAPRIVAGVDLWLNLPLPPLEACGTSGMKVILNGGLNLSVLDGWWAEAYDGENGWAIDTPPGDPYQQDEHDARVLLDLLEGDVIPLFYERDAGGIPRRWLQRVKISMARLIPSFNAERMLRDYLERIYRTRPRR